MNKDPQLLGGNQRRHATRVAVGVAGMLLVAACSTAHHADAPASTSGAPTEQTTPESKQSAEVAKAARALAADIISKAENNTEADVTITHTGKMNGEPVVMLTRSKLDAATMRERKTYAFVTVNANATWPYQPQDVQGVGMGVQEDGSDYSVDVISSVGLYHIRDGSTAPHWRVVTRREGQDNATYAGTDVSSVQPGIVEQPLTPDKLSNAVAEAWHILQMLENPA